MNDEKQQVGLYDRNTDYWNITFTGGRREVGKFTVKSMPKCECPVINTTNVRDGKKMSILINKYMRASGCGDVAMFIHDMLEIGATINVEHCEEFGGHIWTLIVSGDENGKHYQNFKCRYCGKLETRTGESK